MRDTYFELFDAILGALELSQNVLNLRIRQRSSSREDAAVHHAHNQRDAENWKCEHKENQEQLTESESKEHGGVLEQQKWTN